MSDYIAQVRKDFPTLQTKVGSYPLAYLDNAATTQKPQVVIDALTHYYTTINANVHRGVHFLSETATEAYEKARQKVQKFINATYAEECVFVRGTTEAINLVASSFGQEFISAGDEIIISVMEHHSNIVPWRMLCDRVGAKLVVLPLTANGELDLSNFDQLLNAKTKLVAVVHVSNSLGTINPIKDIISRAHAKNVPVLIDGAQALAHIKVDVQDLDCDFYAASSHKCFGPMGIGVLYAKRAWLEKMPPYQGGGEMILKVTFDDIKYNHIPYKFEAGTPSVADAIAWGAAIDYLDQLDHVQIRQHETALYDFAMHKLQSLPGIKFYGKAEQKISIISFTLDGIHPHDIGTIANEYGVAIRTGHHCTMPLMDYLDIPGTARASLAMYNNEQDIEQLASALQKVQALFHRHK